MPHVPDCMGGSKGKKQGDKYKISLQRGIQPVVSWENKPKTKLTTNATLYTYVYIKQ